MTSARRAGACLLAAVLGVLCAVAVGCGSESKLLSGSQATGLKQTLGEVRDAVAARDCDTAKAKLTRLKGQVDALGGSVDVGLRRNLRQDINGTLADKALSECDDPVTETVPTETSTAPPEPTQTQEPTPSTSTPETPTPSVPEVPTPSVPSTSVPPVDPGTEPTPDDSGGFGTGDGTG